MTDLIDAGTFDWRTETTLKGTVSRIGQYVRGECAVCHAEGVLLYDDYDDETLMCASDSRVRTSKSEYSQQCDKCGADGNVWRDPIHRRNEYLCINCHDPESLFQNRWANKVRESFKLRTATRKAVCDAAGYGTECKGEIKWRGAFNKSLCNKHAGKTGVGPNG